MGPAAARGGAAIIDATSAISDLQAQTILPMRIILNIMSALPYMARRTHLMSDPVSPTPSSRKSRAFWLRQLHQWHWVSSAACLVGLLLFSLTGLTLNHAGWIGAKPEVTTTVADLPRDILVALGARWDAARENNAELPDEVADWLAEAMSVQAANRPVEWSEDELYVSLPRAGGDAWLTIDRGTGSVTHELTDRGWISYLNDLHKGRNTGTAWRLFIDVFAVAALVFAITGLLLLKLHAPHRPSTWPMVGLGLALPFLLALLFIH
jgi:hypothetical protein